jgi:acyl-homoserine-lactone acylase
VLTAWDGTAGLDSPGIAVWREAIGSGLYDFDDMRDQGALFADAFDPADPIQTPAVLAAAEDGEDTVLQAIALAVVQLDAAGIPLDATLRDLQFREFDGERVPVLGGPYHEGVIAVATYGSGGNTTLLDHPEQSTLLNELTELTDEGYLINDGNSWIMAMEFTDDGPRARAVMVYAQSEDPASPHFSDQAWLYAEPTLRDVRYRDADIEADPTLEVRHLSHPAEGG